MSSNYPPGVTGNEPQIAGYPNCAECGHEIEEHYEVGGAYEPCMVPDCGCRSYEEFLDVPDPDSMRGGRDYDY